MQHRHLRFPGGKSKAFTMSYDDGWPQDKRFSDIITSYGIKATFNIISDAVSGNYDGIGLYPNVKWLSKEEIKKYILDRGHEIALHGKEHRSNGLQRPIGGIREILNCRLALEKEFGIIVRGMAYAYQGITTFSNGESYESVKHYLKDLDIAYSRSLGYNNNDFCLPNDWYNWIPSTHHQCDHAIEYVKKFVNLKLPKTHSARIPRLLYIWGHTYEFDNNDNWDRLEKICQMISSQNDIWCATNMEIYDYVMAYNSLVYSADETRIYNPTLKDIWLEIDGKTYTIKSDETIQIQ
ncbi:MAG: polysaccharide deacetylase family protein [Clostridia bacterium]|nr:polysaccharide deacetylase family protein [Clostridia bacterium]